MPGPHAQLSTPEDALTAPATCQCLAQCPRRHSPPLRAPRTGLLGRAALPSRTESLPPAKSGVQPEQVPCRRFLGQEQFPASGTLLASTNRFLSYTHGTHTHTLSTDDQFYTPITELSRPGAGRGRGGGGAGPGLARRARARRLPHFLMGTGSGGCRLGGAPGGGW